MQQEFAARDFRSGLRQLRVKLGPRDGHWLMSGLPPTAVIERTSVDGRNVPRAAVSNRSKAVPYSRAAVRCRPIRAVGVTAERYFRLHWHERSPGDDPRAYPSQAIPASRA